MSTQSFVTNNNVDTVNDGLTPKYPADVVNFGQNKEPIDDKTKYTNGPHGAEYQLGRNPQLNGNNGRDTNLNFLNPIKQSRKDTDESPPISLITPLTHLSISGSFPSTPEPSTKHSPEQESSRPNSQQPSGFFTVTTPKNEPSRGIITHMNAISQTRFQSNRVTPSFTSDTPNNEQKPSELIFGPPANPFSPDVQKNIRPEPVKSTEFPFLYTRSRTASSNNDNVPYQGESLSPDLITKTPSDSSFGQKVKPATTSFTAYYPGRSTSRPVNENNAIPPSTDQRNNYKPATNDDFPQQPKFVLRPTSRPAINSNQQPLSNFNGYSDAENRNANFYPDTHSPQKAIDFNDKNRNNVQPEGKYVNTKKEFVPQYNPSSTPIPGLLH